jgi:hypothetical protein
MHFPTPVKLGANLTRWPLSSLEQYEAEKSGRDCEPRPIEDEVYLSDVQLAARYSVARNTIWRWSRLSAGGKR